ncbi:MAG: ethanolamine utilization protein EutA [Dehalococcoidia bacterium]|nr:ethanolamine utilization protein EutA [Dehalococcoidia bacterium]
MVVQEPGSSRFSNFERHITDEEFIRLVSVGVDIGSSTSHLIFSRLILQLKDNRYVTVGREILNASEILLTPYTSDQTTIDGEALGRFIDNQYEIAGLQRDDIDTGALILTGVAVQRDNARAIADLFAQEAGKFVSVSAGDNLEAIMAAYGSGAMALTETSGQTIMNVDIGGGTTKITVCAEGKAKSVAAFDVGARLIAMDKDGTIVRLENWGREFGKAVGLNLEKGQKISREEIEKVVSYMADRLVDHMKMANLPEASAKLLRTPPLEYDEPIDAYTFSGGVSEFVYGREPGDFGDLGPFLAKAVRERVDKLGTPVIEPEAGIRATVIGASQYTVQVSGSTIYIAPADSVPVRNIAVISPDFDLSGDSIDSDMVAKGITDALARFDLSEGDVPVALALEWGGSATFDRLDSFANGLLVGMKPVIDKGHPIILVYDDDIGGLVGIHLVEESNVSNAVISIDRIELKDFDFVDIGSLIQSTGAVPVVIKSLVFPGGKKAPAA